MSGKAVLMKNKERNEESKIRERDLLSEAPKIEQFKGVALKTEYCFKLEAMREGIGKEAELLIAKLAKEGKNASEIGIILRDTYGIPDPKLLFNKKLSKILKEKSHNLRASRCLISFNKKICRNKKAYRNKQ